MIERLCPDCQSDRLTTCWSTAAISSSKYHVPPFHWTLSLCATVFEVSVRCEGRDVVVNALLSPEASAAAVNAYVIHWLWLE